MEFNFQSQSMNTQNKYIFGTFLGQQINASVDNELAALYFKNCIDSSFHINETQLLSDEVKSILKKEKLNNKDYAFLSNYVSVDFSTLVFAQKKYEHSKNKYAQDTFQKYLNEFSNSKELKIQDKANEYLYVFVPGLFYIKHADIGGDFAKQQKMLNKIGLSTLFIKTNEVGSIIENAKIIASKLKEINQKHSKIIVVSASKGGPDLSYALGKLLKPKESKHIKAWISIGGVLRGSQIADKHLNGVNRLWTKIILFFIKAKINFVEDLSQEKSILRYNSLQLPEDLLIIHYVGAPLSSQVNRKVRKSFKELSKLGPNDGLTTLQDELTSQGIVVTQLGLDHYYNDPYIEKKSMALLHTTLKILNK